MDGLSLSGENLAVDAEQIAALHALLARNTADEQCPVDAVETGTQVGRGHSALEQREGAVVQFHSNAFQRRQRRLDLDHVNNDRLIRAEHLAGGDPKQQGITDLTGRTGHRNTNWFFTHSKKAAASMDFTTVSDKFFRLAKRLAKRVSLPVHRLQAAPVRPRRGRFPCGDTPGTRSPCRSAQPEPRVFGYSCRSK